MATGTIVGTFMEGGHGCLSAYVDDPGGRRVVAAVKAERDRQQATGGPLVVPGGVVTI